jgi:hypothetical protein
LKSWGCPSRPNAWIASACRVSKLRLILASTSTEAACLAPAERADISPSLSAFREEAILGIGPPPTYSNAPPPDALEQIIGIARMYDVAERDARNRALGRAGEERVLAHERVSLFASSRNDLAERVRWVSNVHGEGAGYDSRADLPTGHRRSEKTNTDPVTNLSCRKDHSGYTVPMGGTWQFDENGTATSGRNSRSSLFSGVMGRKTFKSCPTRSKAMLA